MEFFARPVNIPSLHARTQTGIQTRAFVSSQRTFSKVRSSVEGFVAVRKKEFIAAKADAMHSIVWNAGYAVAKGVAVVTSGLIAGLVIYETYKENERRIRRVSKAYC